MGTQNLLAIDWQLSSFYSLTNDALYALLRLRSEVFVVEQQCVFLDLDNIDQQSMHVLGYHQSQLIAYTRLVPIGMSYPNYPSIGRVVVSPLARKQQVGRLLMQQSINYLYQVFGVSPIKIGAQLYLQSFYESLGFVLCGAVYDEDGIMHIPMLHG